MTTMAPYSSMTGAVSSAATIRLTVLTTFLRARMTTMHSVVDSNSLWQAAVSLNLLGFVRTPVFFLSVQLWQTSGYLISSTSPFHNFVLSSIGNSGALRKTSTRLSPLPTSGDSGIHCYHYSMQSDWRVSSISPRILANACALELSLL